MFLHLFHFPCSDFAQTGSQRVPKVWLNWGYMKVLPWSVNSLDVFICLAVWGSLNFTKFHSNTMRWKKITPIWQTSELNHRSLDGCGGSSDLQKTPKDSREHGDPDLSPDRWPATISGALPSLNIFCWDFWHSANSLLSFFFVVFFFFLASVSTQLRDRK